MNLPASDKPQGFTTTYGELNDFLFHRARRNNDMDIDGSGYMVVNTYSPSSDDLRDGISILLHFKLVEPVNATTVDDLTIVLIDACREVLDHEWEEYSEEDISTDTVASYDDLLALIQDNEQPKGNPED